ncbi:Myb-binding protein 1A-like protein [Elysia marginata]|uniref:Myb-binding protein 1A-like protein n=1 Tax=Elysia marginata TaxID=1093978 RepID=A0AAV4FFH1_9GAST|nr:Myb-binding protein 1A-like protein [Elysia marginata]
MAIGPIQEVGGIFLGRAFGFSSIVQSGRLSTMNSEAVGTLTNELLTMAEKKSYLKAVCHKTLEDIVTQVSADEFGDHVWLKLRDKMKQGWDSCSLDTLSLLLSCRSKFPDIVTKKFLKKHWGFPILGEENDEKLLKTTLDTVQKTELLLEKIIPSALAEGREISSMWNGFGEKLVEHLPEKRAEVMAQRQLLGVKVASKLLYGASTEQVLDVCFSPRMAGLIFHNITRKSDPLVAAADQLFEQMCHQLKTDNESHNILDLVEKLWKLEASLLEKLNKSSARVDLVTSTNFTRLIDMMKPEEAETYSNILMAMVKGKDKLEVMSEQMPRKAKQIETCLRQLQHLSTSNQGLQTKVLTLFLRLAYFHVDKKVKRHNKKSDRDSHFLELLFSLCQYCQELLSCESVKPVMEWSEAMQEEWSKLFHIVSEIKKLQSDDKDVKNKNSAFQLLLMYLGIQVFSDYKTTSEILQDVYVCYEKAAEDKKKKNASNESDEPAWVEVLTEVLLHLMSLQSHLGRVVTASVFRFLMDHITPRAVSLIAEVLIPKKRRGDDAGGAMVEGDNKEDDEEEEEDDDNMDSDEVVDESSDDDDEDDSNEEEDKEDEDEDMDEEEEENLEVDEEFRNSVRQALGAAADTGDSDEEEKELSDLSDSEMFKLDDMLAEVFRQRKKASGGKKAREEKKAELANFRLRVLDLVENMIKSKRCGDFLLMNITCEKEGNKNAANESGCFGIFEEILSKVISKKQSKPHFSFFTSIIEINPMLFQSFSKSLLSSLRDETVKVYNQTLCCSILTSLCKRVDDKTESEGVKKMKKWMKETAEIVSQIVGNIERDSIKTMFMKELLQLMLALQARHDILQEVPEGTKWYRKEKQEEKTTL